MSIVGTTIFIHRHFTRSARIRQFAEYSSIDDLGVRPKNLVRTPALASLICQTQTKYAKLSLNEYRV